MELLEKNLKDYKEEVNKIGLNPSDRKKLLSLPFYLTKRVELPEPKVATPEYKLFKHITGSNWHDDNYMMLDDEKKITEFDYENFIPQAILKRMDTKSPEFK